MKLISFASLLMTLVVINRAAISQSPPTAQAGTAKTVVKGVPASIPDPSNSLGIAVLAVNPSVSKELGLSQEQISTLRTLLVENGGALNGGVLQFKGRGNIPPAEVIREKHRQKKAENESKLDEIFLPNQWVRLKQIAYQIEVSRIGFGRALSSGVLGRDVGVFEAQHTHLSQKALEIEARAAKEIGEILRQAQIEMLKELSTEQRSKAVGLLGEPFYFRDDEYQGFSRTRFKE